jgi:hypothetical protein
VYPVEQVMLRGVLLDGFQIAHSMYGCKKVEVSKVSARHMLTFDTCRTMKPRPRPGKPISKTVEMLRSNEQLKRAGKGKEKAVLRGLSDVVQGMSHAELR